MATWVGFEPTNRLRFPVFKTGSISHSDTKPYKKGPFGPSAATVFATRHNFRFDNACNRCELIRI